MERIIGFGNPSLIRVLGGNKRVFIDGTFKIVPKPFYQCLIIMVFDEQTDSFVPVFYVLLTSKTEQIYRHALYWVKASSNYKMKPDSITCDFEKALHNAIALEFPNVIINGCLFHWKQAIRRKIRDLKFEEPSIEERFMWRNVLETLTIIPVDQIKTYGIPFVRGCVETDLNKNDLEKMDIFWEYFNKYWMSSPSFIFRWNIQHHAQFRKEKIMRTNNGLERYNRSLKELFNNTQPSLICFIEKMEQESRDQVSKLDRIRKAHVINRKRKREDSNIPCEFSEPSILYVNFVEDCKV